MVSKHCPGFADKRIYTGLGLKRSVGHKPRLPLRSLKFSIEHSHVNRQLQYSVIKSDKVYERVS